MKFIKILLILFVLNSCVKQEKVKQEKVKLDIPVYRFDKEFSEINDENYDKKLNQITSEFPGLTDYYLTNHIGMINSNDSIKRENILLFNSHTDVISFQEKIDNHFTNTKEISNKINESFGIYKYNFPEKEIPENIIFINAFNSYGVDSYINNLIIGLDFYLGEEHLMFDNIYEYLKIRYDEKFMVADAMEYWLSSEFIDTDDSKTFLDELIFKGKIMYIMNECFPNEAENIIFRFTEEDLTWCKTHEENIWNEILKMDLIYKSDESNYISFFHDSPFTKGMPKESPGRLGYFMGYKIIESYMKENNISLKELMKNTNSQEIFLKSRYIPKNQDQDNSIDKQSQESWIKKYWWTIFGFILFLGYFIQNNYVKK